MDFSNQKLVELPQTNLAGHISIRNRAVVGFQVCQPIRQDGGEKKLPPI